MRVRNTARETAGIARGDIALHGWFFDIGAGQVLALDGQTGRFLPITEGEDLPVAQAATQRLAAERQLEAAD